MGAPVELWNVDSSGVIVEMPTGVRWSNQTGGTACHHPEVEGVFVPMPSVQPQFDPLIDEWGVAYDPDRVLAWLMEADLDDVFEPRAEPPSDVEELQEAWIPVRIRSFIPEGRAIQLATFLGKNAIITYPNSD